MEIVRLSPDTLTDAVFEQIVTIEANCGICPYSPEILRECIRFADTYACMDGDTVAGFITMDRESTDYFDVSLHIVNINVAAAYRRQGVAQKMIRTVCRHYAQSHTGLMVTLDVKKTNAPARSLYTRLGFTETDFPSENGDTDLVMAVPLAELLG